MTIINATDPIEEEDIKTTLLLLGNNKGATKSQTSWKTMVIQIVLNVKTKRSNSSKKKWSCKQGEEI